MSGITQALVGGYAANAVTYISSTTNTNLGTLNGTNLLATSLSGLGVSNGDLILAYATSGSFSGNTTVNTAGYTQLSSRSASVAEVIAYKIADGSETSISFNFSSAQETTVIVALFRSAQYIRIAQASGSSGMPDPPAISASAHDMVVVLGGLDDDPITATAPSGYTLIRTISVGTQESASVSMMAYKVVATTDTENPGAFGGGGFDAWYATSIVLRSS